jgi:hypothetical protein
MIESDEKRSSEAETGEVLRERSPSARGNQRSRALRWGLGAEKQMAKADGKSEMTGMGNNRTMNLQ